MLRRTLFEGRHFNFMRRDLERLLCAKMIEAGVELRFGAKVSAISQNLDGVRGTLTDGSGIVADLLVGAGGVHSRVREMIFGRASFIRHIGYNTVAFASTIRTWRGRLADPFAH